LKTNSYHIGLPLTYDRIIPKNEYLKRPHFTFVFDVAVHRPSSYKRVGYVLHNKVKIEIAKLSREEQRIISLE